MWPDERSFFKACGFGSKAVVNLRCSLVQSWEVYMYIQDTSSNIPGENANNYTTVACYIHMRPGVAH